MRAYISDPHDVEDIQREIDNAIHALEEVLAGLTILDIKLYPTLQDRYFFQINYRGYYEEG